MKLLASALLEWKQNGKMAGHLFATMHLWAFKRIKALRTICDRIPCGYMEKFYHWGGKSHPNSIVFLAFIYNH